LGLLSNFYFKPFIKPDPNLKFMKRKISPVKLLLVAALMLSIKAKSQDYDKIVSELKWDKETGAKTSPSGKQIFRVNDYGANYDGKTINTKFQECVFISH
jgi:hypothetical protein